MANKYRHIIIQILLIVIMMYFPSISEGNAAILSTTLQYRKHIHQTEESAESIAEIKAWRAIVEKASLYVSEDYKKHNIHIDPSSITPFLLGELIQDIDYQMNVRQEKENRNNVIVNFSIELDTGDKNDHLMIYDKKFLDSFTRIWKLQSDYLKLEEALSQIDNNDDHAEHDANQVKVKFDDLTKKLSMTDLLIKALAYWKNSKFSMPVQAYEYLNQAYEIDPNNIVTLYYRGMACRNLGLNPKAIEDFSAVIQKTPDDYQAYLSRGKTYTTIGKYEEAIADFDRAISLSPKDPSIYIEKGTADEGRGFLENAVADYTKALEISEDDLLVYFKRASVNKRLSRYKEAASDYQSVLDKDPDNADAYFKWGGALAIAGQRSDGLKQYCKAIELNPKNAEYYKNRGQLYAELNEFANACRDFEKACEFGNCSGIFWAKQNKICP